MTSSHVMPASFRPPAVPDPAGASRARPCVLLDPVAYLADGENATTAQAETSQGQVVRVSFTLADPPAVSYLCVHCPGLQGDDLAVEPVVLCADGAFVLLDLTLTLTPARPYLRGSYEYLLYRAGPGKPSLEPVPLPPSRRRAFRREEVGILHCAQGDGHEVVVAVLELNLAQGSWSYDLHLFSRESNAWTTTAVARDPSCHWDRAELHTTSKVVTVGGGKLGWVDLWRGILVCDVLHDPLVRFVPLPDPMESNRLDFGDTCPRSFRDVTCSHGSFSFVEMEFLDDDHDDDDEDDEDSWTATMWKKPTLSLSEEWHALSSIDVHDISVCTTSHSAADDMLHEELWDDKAMKPSLTKLITASPTLTLLGESVVYMMSKATCDDPRAWMISIDMKTKEMLAMYPFCADRVCNVTVSYHPFSFSSYLDATQGRHGMRRHQFEQ